MIVETEGGWASLLLPFLILVGIGIVGVIVWLVWMLTRSNKGAPAVGGQPAPPPVVEVAEDVPLLVMRRSKFGDWELYVNGQRVRRMAAVTEPEEREELIAALRFLFTFAKGGASSQSAEHADRPGVAADADPDRASIANRAGGRAAEGPPPPPRTPDVERRERYGRVSSQAGRMPAINLAEEIGDILDEMVKSSPDVVGHSIGLINTPSGGIGFAVDGKIYHELSEIPTPEIRTLIRQATKEWERR